MRRYVFYFVVALLAFGFGVFVAVNNYRNQKESFESKRIQYETPIYVQTDSVNNSNSEFVCNDEAIKTVWASLAEDNDFYESSREYIIEHQTKNCLEIFDSVETFDLNNDGESETIIQSNSTMLCSSAWDCRTWIVTKIKGQYKIILDNPIAESLEGLKILGERTNRFHNLRIRLNNGIQEDNVGIFIFNGHEYKLKKCFVDTNSAGDDSVEKLKENLLPVKPKNCL